MRITKESEHSCLFCEENNHENCNVFDCDCLVCWP